MWRLLRGSGECVVGADGRWHGDGACGGRRGRARCRGFLILWPLANCWRPLATPGDLATGDHWLTTGDWRPTGDFYWRPGAVKAGELQGSRGATFRFRDAAGERATANGNAGCSDTNPEPKAPPVSCTNRLPKRPVFVLISQTISRRMSFRMLSTVRPG